MWKLWVRTYEYQNGAEEEPTLVIEHSFFGKTREDALHYSDSHSRTDDFYRDTGGARAARESYRLGQVVMVHGNFKGIKTLTDAEFRKPKR